MTFVDHFGKQASSYRKFRPSYPEDLFAYLAETAPSVERAWDCGTGTGQAALGLAEHFDQVVATDRSAAQLAVAKSHPKIRYRSAKAETSGIEDGQIDLVTVAQALHWFEQDRFHAEVRRVARPGGIVAAWCYELFTISPTIDAVIERLYRDVVGSYWPDERKHIERGYEDLPWPFDPVDAPTFQMIERWSLDQVVGYLSTWSAVQRFKDCRLADPIEVVREALEDAWGDDGVRRVRWPLQLRIGRV